jgi:hypothetical protein
MCTSLLPVPPRSTLSIYKKRYVAILNVKVYFTHCPQLLEASDPVFTFALLGFIFNSNSYKKKQRRPPSNKKRGKNQSPRNREACHSISTARLQSVAELGTQSTTKSGEGGREAGNTQAQYWTDRISSGLVVPVFYPYRLALCHYENECNFE